MSEEPLLVMNGDILTRVNLRAMLDYHREKKADMTVAVRRYEMQVPYGVVDCEDARIIGLREKAPATVPGQRRAVPAGTVGTACHSHRAAF